MFQVAYTNIESKTKINNIAAEVLANLINAVERIEGMQIGDHDIKIVNVADNTTIFLRDITCLNKIQVILKPYENAKIN